jgi:hypothetical protein
MAVTAADPVFSLFRTESRDEREHRVQLHR